MSELDEAFSTLGEIFNRKANEIKDYVELNRDRESDDAYIKSIVTEFINTYPQFYKGKDINKYVTQQLWYKFYLRKKRLEKLGFDLNIDMRMVSGDDNYLRWNYDGKNTMATLNQLMDIKKTYSFNGRKVKDIKHFDYVTISLVESGHDETGYVCPKCGARQNKEQLIDGCDYCGTKFSVNDFYDKVLGMRLTPNESVRRNFVLAIAEPRAQFCASHFGGCSQVYKIGKYDAAFSENEFMAGLDNKLAAIHYAETPAQMMPYSIINLSGLEKRYEHVIECTLEDVFGTEFFVDDNNQVIRLDVLLRVIKISGGSLIEDYEKIKVAMVKDKNAKTQVENEVIAYECPNCGSSISLLNGGLCSHCGTRMNLRLHDWVIGDYQLCNS